jgi:hypothetical protein
LGNPRCDEAHEASRDRPRFDHASRGIPRGDDPVCSIESLDELGQQAGRVREIRVHDANEIPSTGVESVRDRTSQASRTLSGQYPEIHV